MLSAEVAKGGKRGCTGSMERPRRYCPRCRFVRINRKSAVHVGSAVQIAVFPAMAIRRIWSVGSGIAHALACWLVLQTLIAGLHAAHAVDQRLIASDLSICHGGNNSPTKPRPDHSDICCLLACNVSGQAAIPSKLATVTQHEIATTIQVPLHSSPLRRSHLLDRAHGRPRSPPSA